MRPRPASVRRFSWRRAPASVVVLVVAGLVASACSSSPGAAGGASGAQPQTLTLYNAQHEQTTDALVAAFTKATGIQVRVDNDDEDDLTARIELEGSRSPADLFYTENSNWLQQLDDAGLLKGAAHITGGGITDNTPRILPQGLAARIELGSWPVLPIFERLRSIGRIPEEDFRRTFNLGIGMIVVVPKRSLGAARRILESLGEAYYEIGSVAASRGGRVIYEGR